MIRQQADNNNSKKKKASLQSLTLCISTAMVLVLLGLVVLGVMSASNLSDFVRENFVITMTLDDDMTAPETAQLQELLGRKVYTSRLDFISKEQALEEQIAAMGTDPTEFIGTNPFMAAIELHLVSNYANSDSLEWIQPELAKMPKVSEVTYQRDLMDSVNANLRRVSIALLLLAFLLTCISFTLINNTVRLGVYARRMSIHTMKLVGASWGFIRAPFLRRSMSIGLLAAIIADIVLLTIIGVVLHSQPGMHSIITTAVVLATLLSVVAFGLLLTWLCTHISVNKFLRMTAGELFK